MAESADGRPPGRWARVEALFDEAIERPAEQREDWVRSVEPDSSVVAEVLGLIASADRPGILDEPLGSGDPRRRPAVAAVRDRVAAALAGQYRIDRVLGYGGMATVFLAEEVKHNRSVVLKVLRPEIARWVGARRFMAEIRILARLSHPHIIGLIDSGEAGGLLYYVMPYLGGVTLREKLAAGPIPRVEALSMLGDIARALAHAHAQGLVHRDLKPDNVLVVDGHAFLMDFGVAKLIDTLEPSGDSIEGLAVGTPAYMAPEQAAGGPVSARADVYAWGLVARETLTAQRDRSLPRAVASVIASATRSEPEDRPADGTALVAALDRAARTASRPARSRLLVALLLLVGSVTAFLARDWHPVRLENVPGPVTVAPLRNETGDSTLTVWGRLAGDWLTQGLLETGRVAVVPWPVALQGAVAAERAGGLTVAGLAGETGAGTVVTGAFYLVGDRIRLQAQLTDAATGAALASIPAVLVSRSEIDRGIQELRDRVMGVLAIRTDQRFAGTVGVTDRPPTYEAYRIFDRGMDAYNRQEYRVAAADLMEAWRKDTVFMASLVYATRALWNTGDRAAADSLVREIRARPASLGAYHELQVRYLEQVLAGDAVAALATIRAAAAQAPGGRTDYNVALAALAVGRPAEARAALEQIDPDRGAMKGWAPYWFVYTHALHLEGRSEAELAAARELRRRHPESRAGWVHLVRAHASVGNADAIDSILLAASALPPDTYWSQGAMMVTAGEELDAHGFESKSAPFYRQALGWLANQLARDPGHRAHRYWMGSAQYDLGRFADAEPYFESLVRDYPDDLLFKAEFALVAARAGDTALANRRLGAPPRYERGEYLSYQARLAAVEGDRERAIALWSEALAAGMTAVAWIHAAGRRDLIPLLDDPRFQRLGILPAR